jgi:hypothetical protein
MLFAVCVVVALATGLPRMTERGRQAALDMQVQQTERMTGREVTPEQYARMEQFSRYGGVLAFVGVFVAVPVFTLLIGALYWAVFNTVLGGTASFKQVLGIVTHASVIGALGAIAAAPLLLAQGSVATTSPFNLGAALPMIESGFLSNLLGAIDVFRIWELVVTAIGLGVLYRRRSTGIAVALIVAYLAIAGVIIGGISSLTGR